MPCSPTLPCTIAVNGNENDGAFDSNIPISLAPSFTQYGPGSPGTFYSEFGASAVSIDGGDSAPLYASRVTAFLSQRRLAVVVV